MGGRVNAGHALILEPAFRTRVPITSPARRSIRTNATFRPWAIRRAPRFVLVTTFSLFGLHCLRSELLRKPQDDAGPLSTKSRSQARPTRSRW